jgi:2-C-methyl-D-erythritol 4-phosphate cytidylyltransferase/2-C-methyl-D-erythritol 2,4-cyclodiphosphate synthase
MTKAIAIILAAGSGSRAGGDLPKQFRQLAGRAVVEWSIKAFRAHADIEALILVKPPQGGDINATLLQSCDMIIEGGQTRAMSVQNALEALNCEAHTPVLIHDAARPGLSQGMISKLLEALKHADAVAPALPVTDALKDISQEPLVTVDRTSLQRVQTPQCFRYGDIAKALELADKMIVDDLAAIEMIGKRTKLIPGETRLHKITYEEDFEIMERLLSPLYTRPPRMGTGYDVHKFGPGDHVTLCGVIIPHTHGLVGHSDADIGWHALTDAILGAMALGDIGDHFPPNDPQWK